MRRFVTLTASLTLMLGLSGAFRVLAQDEKKDDAKKGESPKVEAPKDKDDAGKASGKNDDAKKDEGKGADAPLPSIPPEVEAKLEAARRAVAEAIVAAQDAGLVQTTIDPPPVLDILVTGRAIDERTVKNRTGVSPEVFGAWFTGYGKLEGFVAQKDIRIIQPSAGLKAWYDQRAGMLNRHIEAVRKARESTKKAEEPKKEEPKKEEPKKEEPKKEEPKKEEPKKEEPKKEEPKADDSKKDDNKADDSKKDDNKADDSKKDENKADDSKKDEPK